MILLKLGGSVITEKDTPETVDGEAIGRAAEAIATVDEPLVVVHGGGSFGHYQADRHGVSREDGTRNAGAIRAIHGAMRELNTAVVNALDAAGAAPVPIAPFSAAVRTADGNLEMPTDHFDALVRGDVLPVTHGDVIADRRRGASILSGDELIVHLARALEADRVGLCSGVPGVLDADGSVISEITALESVQAALGGSESTDVTGGMAGKVETLLDLEAPACVFGPTALPAFLGGDLPGTTIRSAGP
ncbi:MAG: isopentenyl phosphate kinase [Halobacteriaceae archaeon]